ncbi:uncharacterized protein LOC141853644 [Brevipalpus obovatus]|uniref:uncharacterized protein LOC141853644 n=1 Tax=Brevipalpus obovatus TaxID=246614 RepID=UPI003D9FACD6
MFLDRGIRHLRSDSITLCLLIVFILSFSETLIFPRLTTRFCYNSPEPSRVSSQCVLCNYFLFDSTVLGCTGSTALTVNMTAQQAFCVISQCLGQIRQAPMFLGRKKRNSDELERMESNNSVDINSLNGEESIFYEINGVKEQIIVKNQFEVFIDDLSDDF